MSFRRQSSFSIRGIKRGADGTEASAGEVAIERDLPRAAEGAHVGAEGSPA
jgi:hypothetical protein